MTTRPDNTRRIALTTFIMVLSALACAIPVSTTPLDNTAAPTTQVIAARPTPTTAPTTLSPAIVTAFDALHVRQEPGETALVLGYLRHGDQVKLTGKCSEKPKGWAEIVYKSRRAWVRAKYVSKNKCSEEK